VLTYVELPVGVVTLGVNSDDGFRTRRLHQRARRRRVLGQFDGGRGAADTIFKVIVSEAGVYPLRTIWPEGGGGAHLEIFSVQADGTKALLNDTANGGFKAYRVGVAPNKPATTTVSIARTATGVTITFTGRLQTATSVTGPYTDVPGAVSPAMIPATGTEAYYRSAQ
jgi:hypothetical protein